MFKSDQEPAILALKQAVRESMPTVEFVMEESLVEEHQSNGTIEVAAAASGSVPMAISSSSADERFRSDESSRSWCQEGKMVAS